jgi:predicted dehydrogenase
MAGLELSRADFYEKELTFQVSCSYGPGRYDPAYEEGGHDYPFGYVRWTEQRNFEAILDMFADARLCVRQLVTHRFPFEKAKEAYSLLTSSEPSLGILLQYLEGQEHQAAEELLEKTVSLQRAPVYVRSCARSMPVVGVIGAGNYATRVLLPALKKTGVVLKTVVSSRGVSGIHAGRKFGFQETTTDSTRVFADKEIDAVVIATRHDSHAYFVCQALAAGKHVFVEKPLALNSKELDAIEASYSSRTHSQLVLMVGFNRRFAPQTQKMKMLLESIQEPISFIMTVNAGWLPADHWTQDPYLGGGRIIGEGCHFIDLLRFLAGHPITMVQATRLGDASSVNGQGDTASFVLQFTNGSFGVVHYLANGHRAFPKERLEVFCAGRVLRLNNFRRMRGYGWPGFKRMNLWRQDKGHTTEIATFVRAIQQGSPSPIPFGELVEVSRATFQVAELS